MSAGCREAFYVEALSRALLAKGEEISCVLTVASVMDEVIAELVAAGVVIPA